MKQNKTLRMIAILTLAMVLVSAVTAEVALGAENPQEILPEVSAEAEALEENEEQQDAPAPEETETGEGEEEQTGEGEDELIEESEDEMAEEPQTDETEAPEINEETAEAPAEEEAEDVPAADEEVMLLNDTGYVVLEDGVSAVVTTFAQLEEATEENNGIVNVYMGADITFTTNRTLVPASKATYKLSGRDPRTGEQYTVTEYNNTGLANIVVAAGNRTTRQTTMEDMTIINRGSPYGLIGIEDTTGGVEMIVRNVTYTGRQLAYNPNGSLTFEGDNDITILQTVGGAAGEEVAEVRHVTVRGNLSITTAAAYHMFRMNTGASTFTVEGSMTATATRIAAGYGMIQSLTTDNAVKITVQPGGSLYVTANASVTSGYINEITVGEGATFRYEKTGTTAYPTISLRKTLAVGAGATFYASQGGASHLIYFVGVPTAMSGGVMQFDSPELVTLVKSAGTLAMVYGSKNEEFNVVTQYFKYWGSGQDLTGDPTYNFTKKDVPDWEDISIRMTHRYGTPSSLISNHADITASKVKLDGGTRKIIFGQESKATLKFQAEHEETGETISGFAMEDRTAEKWKVTTVQPAEVPGYFVTGYSVDGGEMQLLQDGMAALIPLDDEVNVLFYYKEPVMEISVPVKMMFFAYESNDGEVTSPEYRFENNSGFHVDVSLAGAQSMAGADQVELAEEGAENTDGLWLYLKPQNEGEFYQVDLTQSAEEKTYIGKLSGDTDAESRQMDFELGGMYYGSYGGEAKWPAYYAEFVFEMSGKETANE